MFLTVFSLTGGKGVTKCFKYRIGSDTFYYESNIHPKDKTISMFKNISLHNTKSIGCANQNRDG